MPATQKLTHTARKQTNSNKTKNILELLNCSAYASLIRKTKLVVFANYQLAQYQVGCSS